MSLSDELASIRQRFREIRDDPGIPQGLTANGQSGSMLDYQEDAAIKAAFERDRLLHPERYKT